MLQKKITHQYTMQLDIMSLYNKIKIILPDFISNYSHLKEVLKSLIS